MTEATSPAEVLAALENEAFDMEETARLWGGESQAAPPLRAAASLIRELTEWRPIETAPKDGTRIMLFGPNEFGPDPDRNTYIDISTWFGSRWATEWMEGHGKPTHWRPLPAPPLAPASPTQEPA